MVESLENVRARINEIKSFGSKIKNIKPEFVSNFEEQLKASFNDMKSLSQINQKNNTTKENKDNYHPFYTKSGSENLNINSFDEKKDIEIKINNNLTPEKKELIENKIKEVSKKYNISEDIIKSVIKIESNFDQYAISKAGAMGLMQLMPKTALDMGVTRPFDIEENIEGGTKYLKMLIDKYNGDLIKAFAAYNAGPEKVDRKNDVPDIEETKNYVLKLKKMLKLDTPLWFENVE